MTYTENNPRETVAGLFVTKDPSTGMWYLATHHPRSALKAGDAGWRQHTTVGGGIKRSETPILAMRRELREEYGTRVMLASELVRLESIPPITLYGENSKKWNRYHWFYIYCPIDVQPEPKKKEIVGPIDWYPSNMLEPFESPLLLPRQKRNMLWRAIDASQKLFPEVFNLQPA